MSPPIVLGIDFGTSYSSAAAVTGGRVELALGAAQPEIPSCAYVPVRGDLLVGPEAVREGMGDPGSLLAGIKRILGRAYSSREVRALECSAGYRIRRGPDGSPLVTVRGQDVSPLQIVASILRYLKECAEARCETRIERAVMTAPVTATSAYTRALARAAQMAGLEVLQFIPEPVAGVLSYRLDDRVRRLAVCDFGGGTFDATLIEQSGRSFAPVAADGDMFLGGDDFDAVLAHAVNGSLYRRDGVDLSRDVCKWNELLWRSEAAKRALSTVDPARLEMKNAYALGGRWRDLAADVSRRFAEPRWRPLVERAETVLRRLLDRAGWDEADLDDVVLIGGTTLMPLVQERLSHFFGKRLLTSVRADTAVVSGAALVGAQLSSIVAARHHPPREPSDRPRG